MNGPREWFARARSLFRRNAIAGEIREELEEHLRSRIEQYEREGWSPEGARRRAARRVGSLVVHGDRGYRVRGGSWVTTIAQDVRYALRLFGRARGSSLLAVLTLGLGIGGATTLFSVVDAAILRPLPYPNPEQLVRVELEVVAPPGLRQVLPAPYWYRPTAEQLRVWREGSTTFSQLASERFGQSLVVDDGEAARFGMYLNSAGMEQIREVTEQYFDLRSVTPVAGRFFRSADMIAGAPMVLLLSEGYWSSRYGRDPAAIGRTVTLRHRFGRRGQAVMVGVVPRTFAPETKIWLPLAAGGADSVGRLRPGIAPRDAEADLARLPLLPPSAGDSIPTGRVRVSSAVEYAIQNQHNGYSLNALAGAVALVFLLSCVNVTGLLLVRGAAREAELTVRAALGASRWRLFRQVMTESVVCAAAGGVAGVAVALVSTAVVVAGLPGLPDRSNLNLDVLVATVAAAAVTGFLVGCLPAFRLSRVRLSPALARGARSLSNTVSRRGGQWLIGIEVALAVVLLAGAGLVVRDLGRRLFADVGVDLDRLVLLDIVPVDDTEQEMTRYFPALLDRLRTLPEVDAAGAAVFLLGAPRQIRGEFGTTARLRIVQATPGFIEALALPVREGRTLGPADVGRGAGVVLNETAARILFPGSSAVGRTLDLQGTSRAVLGVVGDDRMGISAGVAPPKVFEPVGRIAARPTVVVRLSGPVPNVEARLRHAALAVGPQVFVERVQSGSAWFSSYFGIERRRAGVLALFGLVGVLLAIVGITGITAYAVARRTREVGIRVALGASPARIVGGFVREAAWPIAGGLAAGLVGAAWAKSVFAAFLVETSPRDPLTLTLVALALGACGIVAALIPARQAARVDPAITLRAE